MHNPSKSKATKLQLRNEITKLSKRHENSQVEFVFFPNSFSVH